MLAAGCADTGKSGAEGTFTFAIAAMPNSLDLAKSYGGETQQIMAPVTEPLERVSGTGEVTPNLNATFKQPDPLTMVYGLRDGVKFSNGKTMTAADVEWSMRHVLDGAGGAQTAGTVPSIAKVEATGPLEVTVTLKYPDPIARGGLAAIALIQEKAFGEAHKEDLGTPDAAPVGTGPYQVDEVTPQKITLTRNPHHTDGDPVADTLAFVPIAEDNSAQLAMRSDSIQGVAVANVKNSKQWEAIDGAELATLPALYQSYLTLDTRTSPLEDVHVRRAIAYSIDRKGLATSIYGDMGTAPSGALLPATLTEVQPSKQAGEDFLDGLASYSFDLAKAKAELAKSAYPDGFSLDVSFTSGKPYSELTISNLAENMKQLGVKITAKPVTAAQWSSNLYGHKDLGIQILPWVPSVPDPAGVIGQFYGKENMTAQHFNLANYSSPEADAAQKILNQSVDKAKRWEAVQTLLRITADEVTYLPLYHVDTVIALSGGYSFAEGTDDFDLHVNGTWVTNLQQD